MFLAAAFWSQVWREYHLSEFLDYYLPLGPFPEVFSAYHFLNKFHQFH
jgi:hypothetical protein